MIRNENGNIRPQTPWNYVLTVIVSAALGAGITWMFTSQRSSSPVISTNSPAPLTEAVPNVSTMPPGESAVSLGNFAYDHQRWPEAIARYQEAIANGIDNADVHTDLGNAYRFSGQPDKALDQYTIAQRINPQHENSLFNQISLFVETMNQPARAIPICEEFIKRFPNSDKLPAVREQLARARGSLP